MLTQVGKYQIVEKIGVGGFGTVYKGRDPFIKRAVAIKTCQSDEEEIKKRFFREAEFAGTSTTANITTIYDFGVTDDGTPYIVQEFLTGEDLDKLDHGSAMPLSLRRQARDPRRRLRGPRLRAHGRDHPPRHQALEHPHPRGRHRQDHGLRHREVHGLAVDADADRASRSARRRTSRPSRSAARPSTRGPTSSRLGVLAYELLTGQKPFTGDHISTVLYKIMNETPAPPATLDPGLPRAARRDRPQAPSRRTARSATPPAPS